MKNENNGALMEIGVIEKIENDKYVVASITRPGMKTLPLKALSGDDILSVGDKVFFFMLPNGDGCVLTTL